MTKPVMHCPVCHAGQRPPRVQALDYCCCQTMPPEALPKDFNDPQRKETNDQEEGR